MRRFILLSGLLVLAVCELYAQEHSLSDTILLGEVNTYATVKKYQAGAKLESISNDQLDIARTGTLNDLLGRFTPLYLKADAGGLANIRFRGTSADHTSINFGGININSLTLGSANFASVPMYLFDGADLQYGSSSAVNGSGSIGGAVYLGLKNNWTNGIRVQATESLASFGEQLYGTKVYVGNGKLESVTRLYYFSRENNFKFRYPQDGKEYTQRGARIENMGLLQELNYRFDCQQWLKTSVWLADDWHEKQPEMASSIGDNLVISGLENKHIRFWSEYENRNHAVNYKAGIGYVHDVQVDGGNTTQEISTERLVAELEAKQDITTNFGYKAGLKYMYVEPDVYSYSVDMIDYEQRADVYASAFYKAWRKLKLTLNLRQQFVTDFDVPFTPSVGVEYRLYTNEFSIVKLNGNISRSYRVPTFNDRFWGTQGNPDLNPEKGMNYEMGIQYQYCSDIFQTDVKLNGFYMDVDDWIEWRPTGTNGDWVPENRSRVISKGVEFASNSDLFLGRYEVNYSLNYSYNPTEIKEDGLRNLVGKRLIYTPEHIANTFLQIKYNDWGLFADASFTGNRQVDYSGSITSPEGNLLDAYALLNCGISKKLTIREQPIALRLNVRNVLDTDYQNQLNYAMPGRNFQLSLSTDLKFYKNN
ncbi:TonB-dependent receptor [Sunxiuqinia sp. sy24]|uniref:TonB-dependent receptor n=1 Tax=Sunxiuqinia sp. sy24 TaxID=3461495 RepID=UPI0040456F26